MGLVNCQLFKNWISGHFPLFCSLCSRILQKFYTAALACFDKRIQWKNQINCVMYVLKMVSFFTPDFSALSQYRREERPLWFGTLIDEKYTLQACSEH
jgi:hypothetical protein